MKALKRSAAVGVLFAALLAGAAACPPARSGVEVEDCDAEDYRNREDDCGFDDADRRKTPAVKPSAVKPAPAKTPGKPNPAKTK